MRLAMIAALFVATQIHAQQIEPAPAPGSEPAPATQELKVSPQDKDGDGAFSFEEFAAGIAEEHLPIIRQIFDKLDVNKDGQLTMTELQAAQARPKQGKIEVKPQDKDGDGAFSFEEFAAGVAEEHLPIIRQTFDKLDVDKDGKLTMAELQPQQG